MLYDDNMNLEIIFTFLKIWETLEKTKCSCTENTISSRNKNIYYINSKQNEIILK